MRLAIPNLDQSDQIHQAGSGLINLFAADFFQILDDNLQVLEGKDWLIEYRKTKLAYQNYNFKDPSNLLKEILRVSTSPLRIPIRSKVNPKDMIDFFDRLEIILDDRNDWIHHNQSFHKESLKSLILDIYSVSQRFDLTVLNECDSLLSLLSGVKPDVSQDQVSEVKEEESSEVVKAIKDLIPDEEPQIGSAVDEPLTEFSYVLHLNGEIRDRKTNELLSALSPDIASNLGALLIARKPNGGRLRVTYSGILLAFFEDHWGYLAKVDPQTWFPEHIKFSV